MPTEILVVDDDRATRQWLCSVLGAEGYVCHPARSAQEATELLGKLDLQLALLDIYLDGSNGVEFLRQVKAMRPDCDCVMMTAHASVETMAQSVKDGAVEYLGKPLRAEELLKLVRRLDVRRRNRFEGGISTEELEPAGFAGTAIVGRSPKMLEVYRAIALVAPTDATVLIVGPSGSGKERVARAIHAHSHRSGKLMTAINCGALAESVLESELFGHEKGAFTGADRVRQGLFENTNGGTIFLDEISETAPGLQVTLLRVLQEKQIRRLGSNIDRPVDVRILAATNADIGERIRDKTFREDLYYRLSVVTIPVPSLEDRREDIPLLVRHFLTRFNQRNSRQTTVSQEGSDLLARLAWPGNVRELENLIERAAIFSTTEEVSAEDIERARVSGALSKTAATEGDPSLRAAERQQIVRAISEAAGNRSLAARNLGIERKTLYNKAQRLGIDLDAPEK